MNYISYTFHIKLKNRAGLGIQQIKEILIAELGYAGFESFTENDQSVIAYIQEKDWNERILDDIELLKSTDYDISSEFDEIEQVNWNHEWEKNFEPIQVDHLVSVRAPFHKQSDLKYDIVIEPKMSFGTGHHETTHLMIQQIIDIDVNNMIVLDMGCGTGILAIFTEMKGAVDIDAIDIDEWCYKNTIENIERNFCRHIKAFQGDVSALGNKKYDLIIANINRNILLQDIEQYAAGLNKTGILLLSGFYQEDISIIDQEARKYGLKFQKRLERNNWISLKYVN